jgi:signal transduction histidine kinase
MDAVGQLAAGIAHDFNNLLMVISSYSELMVDKLSAADPLRKNGEQILKAARRAGELTGQLLAFSRKQVQALRVLDLSAVLEEIGKILPGVLGDKIQVTIVPNKQLWPVKADPAQIEQILINLATNARDAMPQGGQLTIETANVEFDEEYTRSHIAAPAGEYVMLAISDTGTGIERTVLPRVFEPFFTTKGSGKGTGLGLSTVYGIVKQSGGYVWVYSEVGLGTTFKVYLPRENKAQVVGEVSRLRELPLRGNETVLIVDDEEQIREATRIFLEQYGYSVLSAKDGHEAIELAHQHHGTIAMMVTDVVMPELSGSELAKRLTGERA